MGTNILANINIASTASSTGSWATITGLSVSSITVQGTNSVLLLMFQMSLDPSGDNSAEFRLVVNGSGTNSPVLIGGSDSGTNSEIRNVSLVYAVTGLSGSSNSFACEWRTTLSGCAADTTRNRTFQILEITDGEASIKVDSGVADQTADPGSWGNLFQTTGVSIAGTSSVILMLGNVPINLEADEATDFQFGVNNTGEGAVTCGITDSTSMGCGWSGMHALDGLSAGDHSFELKWQARTGAGQTDGGRRRTFQVIEITASVALKLEKITSGTNTAPGSFADVTTLTDSFNVSATDAIILTIANMMIAGDSSDATADFSLGVDGSNEGAEMVAFADNATIVSRILMMRLKTGLSAASHSFQLRWQEIAGASVADTGRARTLFAIEFTQIGTTRVSRGLTRAIPTYKLDGVTYDKDAVALGSVECYLYKDNGDNTLTWLAYQLSHSTTGVYSFTGLPDNDSAYLVVFFKDDSPTVMDVTDHDLTPVAE